MAEEGGKKVTYVLFFLPGVRQRLVNLFIPPKFVIFMGQGIIVYYPVKTNAKKVLTTFNLKQIDDSIQLVYDDKKKNWISQTIEKSMYYFLTDRKIRNQIVKKTLPIARFLGCKYILYAGDLATSTGTMILHDLSPNSSQKEFKKNSGNQSTTMGELEKVTPELIEKGWSNIFNKASNYWDFTIIYQPLK